jgi:hypothetical protein
MRFIVLAFALKVMTINIGWGLIVPAFAFKLMVLAFALKVMGVCIGYLRMDGRLYWVVID